MNSKLMIIRVVCTPETEKMRSFLEDSLNTARKRYYGINEMDKSVAEDNERLNCMAVFVIFSPHQQGRPDEITRLFVGEGCIARDERGWRIDYEIASSFHSKMIINNFISNSELDINEDYESQSYLMIEDNPVLVRQLSDLIYGNVNAMVEINDDEYPSLRREDNLHEYSQKNEFCQRPYRELPPFQENRSEYQRDYERIIHSKAFRRLVDKAQIFTSSKGDHYRTRMTHTLEVAQIARGIAHELNLNVELTEAIALAHDLGHTPFGHQGERTLDLILKGKANIIKFIPGEENECMSNGGNYYGGFKHNLQGLRVTNYLEEEYVEYDGLNLSYQVLEGILKHTSFQVKDCEACKEKYYNQKCFDLDEFLPNGSVDGLYPQYPFATTLEGQIVAIADEIAQRSHDLDDALAANLIDVKQLRNYLSIHKAGSLLKRLDEVQEALDRAQESHRLLVSGEDLLRRRIVSIVITHFVDDVVACSKKNMENYTPDDFYQEEHRFSKKLIRFSQSGKFLCDYLGKIISKKVIGSAEVVRFDSRGAMIVSSLFRAYYNNPRLLPKEVLRKAFIAMRKGTNQLIDFSEGDRAEVGKEIEQILHTDFSAMSPEKKKEYSQKNKILIRAIADYISGMTDSYAINEYRSLFQ